MITLPAQEGVTVKAINSYLLKRAAMAAKGGKPEAAAQSAAMSKTKKLRVARPKKG